MEGFSRHLQEVAKHRWRSWSAIVEDLSTMSVTLRNGRLRASQPPLCGRRRSLFLNAVTSRGAPLTARFDPLPVDEFACRLQELVAAADLQPQTRGPRAPDAGRAASPEAGRPASPEAGPFPQVPLASPQIQAVLEARDFAPLVELAAAVPPAAALNAMSSLVVAEAEWRGIDLILPGLPPVRDEQTSMRVEVTWYFAAGTGRYAVARRTPLAVQDVSGLVSSCIAEHPAAGGATGRGGALDEGFPAAAGAPRVRLEPRAVSRLLTHLLLAMLDAQNVAHGGSYLTPARVGERCLGDISLVDDATLPYGLLSRRFDYEGSPSRRIVLFERGAFRRPLGTAAACGALGFGPSASVNADLGVGYTNLTLSVPTCNDAALDAGALVVPALTGFGLNYQTGEFVLDAETAYRRCPDGTGGTRRQICPCTISGSLFAILSDPRTEFARPATVDNLTVPHILTAGLAVTEKTAAPPGG